MSTPAIGIAYTAVGGSWVTPGRPSISPGDPPATSGPKLRINGCRVSGPNVVAPPILADWSPSNLPWEYGGDTTLFTADWPSGTPIVDIQTASGDFYTNLMATVNAAGHRVVVRLQAGVYHFNQFRLIGSSGDPNYAFGFWHSNLQGLLGQGPDQTFVQMDANSMTTAQINKMATYTAASFTVSQMGVMRIDGAVASSPILLAGITFRSADQNMQTAVGSDVNAVVPQPASHLGVAFYGNGGADIYSIVSYCRFQGFGRAMTSAPPFEQANLSTGRGHHSIHNNEFDGRRSPDLDPARPRRCTNVMGNGEFEHRLVDCWLHHSNVSRYAMNDQSSSFAGVYEVTRCKLEQITNNQNTDPALNGGVSLGGWTNASDFGWESTNAEIDITDPYVSVDNGSLSGQFPAHYQLTSVGSRNPQGGRMHLKGGTHKHTAIPQLDGYITFRIAKITFWWTDGVATTLDIRRADNTPLIPFEVTGTWPPSAAQLASAGVSPTTHYLYKGV